MFKVVEKQNHLAVHAICDSRASAERWIALNAREYCSKGFFMDKTLTPESFQVLPPSGESLIAAFNERQNQSVATKQEGAA